MAFAALNPLAALWRQRGCNYVLMPAGFDAFAQATPEPAARSASTRPAPSRPDPARPAPVRPAQRPTPPRQAHADRNAAPDDPARLAQGGTVHPFRPSASDAPGGGSEAAWRPLPPHVWPAPWRDLLGKTRPGHIAWTYWNLGPDIHDPTTPGRTERRAFLQHLLRDLGHPAGTHTFWPVCLPPDPDALPPVPPDAPPGSLENAPPAFAYAPAPDVFWSGARQLRARGVVVLGSTAGQAVGLPGGLRPLQQLRHRGHLVWILWDVENLLAQEQRYASMLAFLRQAFLQILR